MDRSQDFGNSGEVDQRMTTLELITMVGIDERKAGAHSSCFPVASFWDLRNHPESPPVHGLCSSPPSSQDLKLSFPV